MINGVEILCTVEPIVVPWVLVVAVAMLFIGAMISLYFDETSLVISMTFMLTIMSLALGAFVAETGNSNYTIVRVSPDASYIEFASTYKVIEQHDDIYFVRPLEVKRE